MTGPCAWCASEPPLVPLAQTASPSGAAYSLQARLHGMGAAAVAATNCGAAKEPILGARDTLLIACWCKRVEQARESPLPA